MKALGVNEEAIEPWEKTYYYSKKALESADVPQNMKQTIQEQLPMVLFYLGYCLFFNEENDKAISFLSQQAALADPACRVVLGLCYADNAANIGSGQGMARALPLLKEVDTAGVEEDGINYMAYMDLAMIYRAADNLQVPGIRKDVNLARDYVLKATHCGEGWGEEAKKELQKYKRNLFGGYTYAV